MRWSEQNLDAEGQISWAIPEAKSSQFSTQDSRETLDEGNPQRLGRLPMGPSSQLLSLERQFEPGYPGNAP